MNNAQAGTGLGSFVKQLAQLMDSESFSNDTWRQQVAG